MVPLVSLWLPIVVGAVIAFVASAILHMVLPYHKNDYKKLPDEEAARAAMRGAAPGLYMTPHCTHEQMKSPEAKEKFKQGPNTIVTVMPAGEVTMGKYLGLWFVFLLIVNFFVAYLASRTLAPGTHYLQVFRVVGTGAFLALGLANMANGIWKSMPWSFVVKEMADGLIYALLIAGSFGWLWPR
ncbi:MAG TPA: hypothetical protein VLA96_05815 [Terriglobales bacterium]|jgi:hypothetical protein|nr:hypothetical protein [Terriglobales bacterium]